ncbi:MAG TPA: hypothetical protein VFI08_01675 [Spirochaetia bacterium]|nr:hypothetical protein [Spirochaetia bacterium]
MKRAGLCIAVCALLAIGIPVFAQQQPAPAQPSAQTDASSQYPKDVYYKVIPLMKVWTHQLGYVVQFYSSKQKRQDVYIPLAWFNNGVSSKADIVYGMEAAYPYMAIYWADGKFDHVTLYVNSDDNNPTNGVLTQGPDLTNAFNVQEIPRDF